MDKLHITQDDYDNWMLSLEQEDGTMSLLAHQFSTPDKLVEMANELVREGKVIATVVIAPPQSSPGRKGAPPDDYKPAPRKAGV